MQRRHVLALPVLLLAACSSGLDNDSGLSRAELEALQTRVYNTEHRVATFRSVLTILRNLGFVVVTSDPLRGSVTARREPGYVTRMTVTVQPSGAQMTMVRAVAGHDGDLITDPEPYQVFFDALSKTLVLAPDQGGPLAP